MTASRPTSGEAPLPHAMNNFALELVEIIADFLDNESLRHLRLSCRSLQAKTFPHFARRFFSSIGTDLSDESLRRIHAISQSPDLGPYVQSLTFMLEKGVGHGLVWDRHPWGPLSAPMKVDAVRQFRDDLIYSLPNCRSFFIYCRFPEGHPGMTHVTMTDAVAVFFALVLDARLPVVSFHLIYANRFSHPLIMDMRRLPKLLYRQPEFKVLWSNLQKLSLAQYLNLDNFGFLLELVLSAPNLQSLILNLGSHDLACEFMHELAEMASFQHLRELVLSRMSVRAPDLQNILGDVRGSLTGLTLYQVSLSSDDKWNDLLRGLAGGFESLQSISLYNLCTTIPTKEVMVFPDLEKVSALCERPGQRLHMFYQDKPEKQAALGFEYSGSRMDQVLSLLQTT